MINVSNFSSFLREPAEWGDADAALVISAQLINTRLRYVACMAVKGGSEA